MKTLNENLAEEFEELLKDYEFQKEEHENLDFEKLKRIFQEFLKEKDNRQNHSKAARKVVNTVLNKEFSD